MGSRKAIDAAPYHNGQWPPLPGGPRDPMMDLEMAQGIPTVFPGYAREEPPAPRGLAALADRLLEHAGDFDGAEAARAKLRPLRAYLLLHGAFELTLYGLDWGGNARTVAFLFAGGLALCLATVPLPHLGRTGTAGGAALVAAATVWLFPGVSNQFFLLFVCLAVLSLLDLDADAEAETALQALRWITATVLFWTGLQKVLYGSYFHAELLTLEISKADRFTGLFRYLMPEAEFERLRALHAGPYRTSWVPLIVASNAVWIAELLLPLSLIARRARRFAVPLTIVLFVAIEAGAREPLFGTLLLNLLLLFTRGSYNRSILRLAALAFAVMLAVRLGWLPEVPFH